MRSTYDRFLVGMSFGAASVCAAAIFVAPQPSGFVGWFAGATGWASAGLCLIAITRQPRKQ